MFTRLLCLSTLLLSPLALAKAAFEKSSGVASLTEENFKAKTSKDNRVVWVLFHTRPGFQAHGETWIDTADKLKGLATVAAVDCTQHTTLCESEANLSMDSKSAGYAIKFYSEGKEGVAYTGPVTAKEVDKAAKEAMPSYVVAVKNKGIKKFNKDKSMPKAILFTKTKTTSALWKSMSVQFKGRMKLGESKNTDRKVVRNYDVDSFPSLVVIPAKADDDDDDDYEAGSVPFTEKLTASGVLAFLQRFALEGDDDDEEEITIEELTDQSCLEALCGPGLCALLVLSYDAEFSSKRNHKQSLLALEQVKQDSKVASLFEFVWVNGLQQPDFLSSMGLEPRDYPQMVVLSVKKNVVVPFVGTFSIQKVDKFIQDMSRGRVKPMPLQGELALSGATTRCEGMTRTVQPAAASKPKPASQQTPAQARPTRGFRGGKGTVQLKSSNFEKRVLESKGNWLVLFTKGESEEVVEEFSRGALALKNLVRFGHLDCDIAGHEELAATYGVTSFPAVIVLPALVPKSSDNVNAYDGDLLAAEFEATARELLDAASVTELKPDGIGAWFSTEGGVMQPRIVLYTDKEQVPDLMRALALEYAGELPVAVVLKDSLETMAAQFNITSFPAVGIMQGQPDGEPDAQGRVHIGIRNQLITKKAQKNINTLCKVFDDVALQWWRMLTQERLKQEAAQDSAVKDEL